jgi:hypothetical protein
MSARWYRWVERFSYAWLAWAVVQCVYYAATGRWYDLADLVMLCMSGIVIGTAYTVARIGFHIAGWWKWAPIDGWPHPPAHHHENTMSKLSIDGGGISLTASLCRGKVRLDLSIEDTVSLRTVNACISTARSAVERDGSVIAARILDEWPYIHTSIWEAVMARTVLSGGGGGEVGEA